MKVFTDSFSFLIQVVAVAFAAGLGWQFAAGVVIAFTEHLRNRLLARRIKRQAEDSLDVIKRADASAAQAHALQESCCLTYFTSGGMLHGERCVFRKHHTDKLATTSTFCECPFPAPILGTCAKCQLPVPERAKVATA